MLDFFGSFGDTVTNIFTFIGSVIDTFKGIGNAVKSFFEIAGAVISILPVCVQVIIYAALALLVAFIVIELLRDFL